MRFASCDGGVAVEAPAFIRTIGRSLRSLSSDRAGGAAVEFALLLPMLVLLLAGLIDISRLVLEKLQVRAAAQAGADYAQRRGWDAAAISAAVTAASPLAASANPAPQVATACITAGALAPTTAAACPNGLPPARFLTVSAQAPFRPIAPWPGVQTPAGVTAQAVVRLP